ncbi:MAG: phosphoribosyltransferase [Dehalococcoidia bacterium]|nr:MAG: phosphoribosyltransferase [Dehalococcoidia bacterium]
MGNLHILSRNGEPFRDRLEAGRLLGYSLKSQRLNKPVVLGIPRGGLVVAREVSRMLDGELDIVLARKLRAPQNQELAIGSVSETGKLFLDESLVAALEVSEEYIAQEKNYQMAEIARRMALVRSVLPKMPLEGREVIVTDDGVATGSTLQAALWAARHENPSKLIAAMPVGPEDTVRRLAADCDEMLVARVPSYFSAVGQFYLRFDQVEDEEVLSILKGEARSRQQKVEASHGE